MHSKISALYFGFFAAAGALVPYFAPHLHKRGLSDAEIGWILGLGSLVTVISPLVVGRMADARYGPLVILRWIFLLCIVLCLAFAHFNSAILLAIIYILLNAIRMPCFGLLDGITFTYLDSNKSTQSQVTYETIRVWGSFGFALVGALTYFFLQLNSNNTDIAFYVAAFIFLITLWLSKFVRVEFSSKNLEEQNVAVISKIFDRTSFRLAKTKPLSTFLIVFALLSFSSSVFDSFHGRYLQELNVPESCLGPIWSAAALIEAIFVAYFAKPLSKKGPKFIMLLGGWAMTIRLIAYASGASLAWLLLAQIMHGPLALALYYLPQKYLDSRIPQQYRNSMQGFLRAVCLGVPVFLGPILAGIIAENSSDDSITGLRYSFAFSALLALPALIWFTKSFKEKHILAQE